VRGGPGRRTQRRDTARIRARHPQALSAFGSAKTQGRSFVYRPPMHDRPASRPDRRHADLRGMHAQRRATVADDSARPARIEEDHVCAVPPAPSTEDFLTAGICGGGPTPHFLTMSDAAALIRQSQGRLTRSHAEPIPPCAVPDGQPIGGTMAHGNRNAARIDRNIRGAPDGPGARSAVSRSLQLG